jgi:small-conductance mechanosensitive channel
MRPTDATKAQAAEADGMLATLTDWSGKTMDFLPNLLLILVILVATRVVSRRTQRLVQRLAGRTEAPSEVGDLLGRLARLGILAVGILLVLDRLGWSQAALSFVAGLGILGIAIGFALQDIVKQFAAGVLLLMLRPFRVGDDVKIGAFEGRVTQVQLRATVLKTDNGDEVLIPNADVYTTAITNTSRYSMRRHTIALTLPAASDTAGAGAAIRQAVAGVQGVAHNPGPAVVAAGFDEQATKLEVRFWVDERASDSDLVKTEVVAAIRAALKQPGAEE